MFTPQSVIDKIIEAEALGASTETIKEKIAEAEALGASIETIEERKGEFSRTAYQWIIASNDATNLINAAEEFLQEEEIISLQQRINQIKPGKDLWQRYKYTPRKMIAQLNNQLNEIMRKKREERGNS